MAPHNNTLHDNFDVDYVITYRFADTCKSRYPLARLCHLGSTTTAKAEASKSFQDLLQVLATVGLAIEVRNGENCSLLVFVKVASDERLNNAVYRSRCVPKSPMSQHILTEFVE